jgi:hypothetical protein
MSAHTLRRIAAISARTFPTVSQACLLLSAISCGDDSSEVQPKDVMTASASTAGSSAAGSSAPRRWRGTQFCEGSAGTTSIKKTSKEAVIGAYTKSTTRVMVSGIDIGPSDEYSCTGVSIAALVTMGESSSVFFDSDEQTPCTSPTGRSLVVGKMFGHDFVSGSPFVSSSLKFDVRIAEATDDDRLDRLRDGGMVGERIDITCTFSLEM